MNFLVIQHLEIEPPALIAEVIRSAGHHIETVHIDSGEKLPADPTRIDGVVIMGGPQSANDSHLPYICDELIWLQQQIHNRMPMLGICLGAQLMAKACGSVITASPVRELGWYPLYPTGATAADPLFREIPGSIQLFQWHGETFSLNQRMTLLATHPDVPAQIFRLGQAQYGLQCHIEIDRAIIAQWIEAGCSERQHLGEEGIHRLHRDTAQQLQPMQYYGRQVIRRWLQQVESTMTAYASDRMV